MDAFPTLIPIASTDESNKKYVRFVWGGGVSGSGSVPSHNLGIVRIQASNMYTFAVFTPKINSTLYFTTGFGSASFQDNGTVISNVVSTIEYFWLFSWT